VLVVDAGNTFWGTSGVGATTQGKVMAEAMNLMEYDAAALGETDLQLGENVLRLRLQEARFPVLSANVVVQATGKLFAQPYLLLERGGRTLGIIGLTGSGSVPATSEVAQPAGASQPTSAGPAPSPLAVPTQNESAVQPAARHVIGTLAVVDPMAALNTVLKEVRARASVVIVLSNLGLEANQRLADTVPGIALIVSAGPGQMMTTPWQSAQTGTLVCQDGVYPQAHPGQLVANVSMHLDSAGAATQYSGSEMALGPEIDDSEPVRKLLDGYVLQQ
jgi:2',3'-cyclic-nucleotide 2'-phosphodiesterase (5'-nucleotidase family)